LEGVDFNSLLEYNSCKKVEKETEVKNIFAVVAVAVASVGILASAPACAQNYNRHQHHNGTRDIIIGTVIGGVVTGVIMNSQRGQVIVQPQVVYQPEPQVVYQPAPQKFCEVKFIQDQFGQVREFTACYYR